MFKTALIAASAASLIAVPSVASAQYYPGQYGSRYDQRYDNYNRYNGYNGQTYYGNRCSGTTGTIVGGVAGAVVGSQIGRGRGGYDYYGNRRGGSASTTGALIGGAVGALLGRKVDKDSCKSRNRGYNYGYRY